MKKRFLSLILSLCMVVTIYVPTLASTYKYYTNSTVPSYT